MAKHKDTVAAEARVAKQKRIIETLEAQLRILTAEREDAVKHLANLQYDMHLRQGLDRMTEDKS